MTTAVVSANLAGMALALVLFGYLLRCINRVCGKFLLYGAPVHTATSPPHQLAIARHVLWLVLALSLAGEIVITRATLHRRG